MLKAHSIMVAAGLLTLTGCATQMTSRTYGPDTEKNMLKTTKVKHTWWCGLPALAPMDASIKDGDFEIESRALKIPDGWFGVVRD